MSAIYLLQNLRRQGALEKRAAVLCDRSLLEPTSLSSSLDAIEEKLSAVRHRLTQTHPITEWRTREHLRDEVAADLDGDCGPRLLGLIRFKDFDRLAGFDHAVANASLKVFADRLRTAVKASHCIGQMDRDCFGIWFRGEIDLETAAAEFLAVLYVARQELFYDDHILTPNLEMAWVASPRDGLVAEELLLRGTAALTHFNANEGGELTLTANMTREAAREQFVLEQDLAQAIQEDQLTMVFQPVVDLTSRRVLGAEALLRWDHPSLGAISPARFIPIVEAIGLSDQYGIWVLNAACREAKAWQEEGLQGLKVAVNLSARQLLEPGLKLKIERTLKRHNLSPKRLELELTETAAMADAQRTGQLFKELRDMGVSLAIDDFGSGYSGLSYLKNLPFDKLKIDREFVTDLDTRRDSRAICRALLELGRGLDLVVLAEGVETEAEVSTLRALGCHVFQGYFFSKPLSGPDFRQFCKSANLTFPADATAAINAPLNEDRLTA